MSFLDKLPKLPFRKSLHEAQYFFALNISSSKVEAALWALEGNKLHIINTSVSDYTDEADLIDASNYVLDQALADFETEPDQVLFGVPDFWLQDDNLKPEYLKLLKKLVKEVDLRPMAYVSTSHAIAHLLQKQQGVPLTSVLVQIDDPLSVSVVKGGKIVSTKAYKRTEDLPQDIEKALLTFSDIEVLPAKILLFGTENLKKFEEELVSYSWMSQLPFLHLPKVETLTKQTLLEAICFAGGTELNPAASLVKSAFDVPEGQVRRSGVTSLPLEEKNEQLENVGFVQGDISQLGKTPPHQDMPDEDYAVSRESALPARREMPAPEIEDHHSPTKKKLNLPSLLPYHLSGIKFFIIPLLIVAFLVALVLFLPKAKVSVFIDMKVLEKETTVTADPNIKQVDEANKTIPGKIVTTDVNGSSKAMATGKKQVGDPAKGSVLVYNKTDAPKTFSTGTILIGPGGINFTLDSSVNIASQSAVDGGIKFGSTTANVTASEIGPDGNLAAGKELTIKGQDTANFSAKVDQAFSGGVSKDVTVVTSDDQKKLLAQLTSDLRKKAKDELQTKLSGDQKILEEGLSEKITKQTFSKNINDQANEFSLTLTVNYKGTAYSEADLKSIVSKLVETNVEEGYQLDLSQTETQADVAKIEKDGKLIFTAKFRAKLRPKLDIEKLKKEIAGKSVEEAASKLKEIESVIGSDIELTPSLPKPLQRLPFLPQNISLEVTAK